MNGKLRNTKEQLKDIHNKHIRRLYKFIPIIGVILLWALFSSQKNINWNNTSNTDLSFSDRVLNAWNDVSSSFRFDNLTDVLITLIILITLWTGYKYWLLRVRYLRNNARLLENIIIAVMVLVFVDRHIKLNSFLGSYIDWILFLIFLYLTLAGSWYIAKTIDRIDLSSDLYCWGLRILAAIVIFFGINFLFSSTLVLAFSNSKLVFNNIYWIMGVCMTLLGAFMGFRSVRRYPMIKIW